MPRINSSTAVAQSQGEAKTLDCARAINFLPATQIQDSDRDLDSTFGPHLSSYHVSATWEAWPGTWTALVSWQLVYRFL